MTLSGLLHVLKKNKRSIITYAVMILLSLSLAVSFLVIGAKNKDIKENKTKISKITQQLDEANDKNAQEVKKNDQLSKELEQAKTDKANIEKEKSNLENENKNLKDQIEKLNAQKAIEAEKLTALQNSPQSVYPPATKVCYLTFDDGPSDNTLSILNTLDKYNAKATFFVSGSNSKLEYVKQIYAKGHTVGLHTNTHQIYNKDSSNIYSSSDTYFNDLNAISNRVEQLIGIKSKVIRFPGGGSNVVSKKVCAGIMTTLTRQVMAKGYAYFDWNVDSGDASGNNVSSNTIVNNVLNQAKGKTSICVLMHDSSAKKTTVQALPAMLEGLKKMGYRFEALDQNCYGFHHGVNN